MNDVFDKEAKETKYVLLKPETTPIYSHLNQTDDEIDLFELFNIIYKKKWLIIGITLLSLIVTSLYCAYAKKVYEVKYLFSIKPYSMIFINDWQELIDDNGKGQKNTKQNFITDLNFYLSEIADKKLSSIKHEEKFLEKFKIDEKDLYPQLIKESNMSFEKYFNITIPRKETQNKRVIALRAYKDIETTKKILNQYIEFSEDEIKQEVVTEQKAVINSKRLAFEEELKLNKQKEKELNKKALTNKKTDNYSADLYADKTNTLVLRNNQLLINIEKLKNLKSQLDKIKVFEIDYIDVPKKPFKPKTIIIISLAFMIPLFISICFVLFLNALQNRKKLNLKVQ